jgi:hypothetical protein
LNNNLPAHIAGLGIAKVRRYRRWMHYKRYEYSVIQAAGSADWSWTVYLGDGRTHNWGSARPARRRAAGNGCHRQSHPS